MGNFFIENCYLIKEDFQLFNGIIKNLDLKILPDGSLQLIVNFFDTENNIEISSNHKTNMKSLKEVIQLFAKGPLLSQVCNCPASIIRYKENIFGIVNPNDNTKVFNLVNKTLISPERIFEMNN